MRERRHFVWCAGGFATCLRQQAGASVAAPHKMYDSLKRRQCPRGAAAVLGFVMGAAAQAVLPGVGG